MNTKHEVPLSTIAIEKRGRGFLLGVFFSESVRVFRVLASTFEIILLFMVGPCGKFLALAFERFVTMWSEWQLS